MPYDFQNSVRMCDSLVHKLSRLGSESELITIRKYKRDENEENANSV